MREDVDQHLTADTSMVPKATWRRFWPSQDGAAAIEFAILAIPYFMIVFAIIETFVAFTAEQMVSNAVENISRQLKTGQITVGLGRSTDKTQTEFRKIFCDDIAIVISCSAQEISTPDKLFLDVRSFTSFANIPTSIPRKSTATYADIDTTSFDYKPGGPKSINMVRAYYRWQIITDLVRPYITNIRPSDSSIPSYFLIVATSAFQNEDYP
jgi:Flp pilus assembly protein TadG